MRQKSVSLLLKTGIILILLINGCSRIWGQTPRYVIHHYTSENGLPQNSVKFLLFDKNDFLWMGTESGLIRFDNHEFKVFGIDNVTGLQDERIQDMKIDSLGNVSAANLNNQSIYTIPANNFSSPAAYLLKTIDPYYYPTWGYLNINPEIGTLWDSIQNASTVPLIRQHAALRNGDIYLIHGDDIYFIENQAHYLLKSWSIKPVANVAAESKYMIQFWKSNQIHVWENAKLRNQNHLEGDILNCKDYHLGKFTTFWSPNGSFIYAANNLYRIMVEENTITTKEVLHAVVIENPSSVYYQPKNNTYYFGSYTNGLYVIKVSDFHIPRLPARSGQGNLYAVARLPNDDLIVRNTVIPRQGNAYFEDVLSENLLTAYVDSSGVLYYDNGYYLTSYQSKTRKTKRLIQLDEHLVGILPYGKNSLLLCTHSSICLVSKSGQVYWNKKLPIPYDTVMASGFFPLQGDQFMLLTTKGAKWYRLNTNTIEKSILDSVAFRSFYLDKQHRIWLGSDGFGSFLLSKDKIYKFPLGPEKAFKSVHAFIDDRNGGFWLTTNNGLYKVNVNQLVNYLTKGDPEPYIYAMDKNDGLPTNEFNGGSNHAYQRLSDGTLALPSMHGLVEFNPDSLVLNYPKNPILLDELRIDSAIVKLEKPDEITKLKADFGQLTIKINCPYFGNPRNLLLTYEILSENQGGNMIAVPSSGVIHINQLPAGSYKIRIKALGASSNDERTRLDLKFIVLPHFYNTWWFYILMLLFFAVVGYFISRQRIITLKRKNLRIEQMIAERTADLQKTTEQLAFSESALKESNKVKEQIITMVLHDLRSPVRFLGTISQHIVQNFSENSEKANLDHLKKLNKSVALLWSFVEQFFSWAISQQNAFSVKVIEVSVQEVFNNVTQFYNEILTYNENQLLVDSSDLICKTDQYILILILRNLLDNANKNTEGGKIWIKAVRRQEITYITVKDTGKGMSEGQIQQFLNVVKEKNKTGNGSMVILQMLNRIQGTLSIDSEPGKGSCFTIGIPQLRLSK